MTSYVAPSCDICPRCNKRPLIEVYTALSRRDNKTAICSECGQDEALFDFVNRKRTGPAKDLEAKRESEWLEKQAEVERK